VADTGCVGKHARVLEFLIGKTVTAYGYGSHLPSTPDLPIANVMYAYDHDDGSTSLLLHFNQQIYMGDKMENSLLCPNQCRLHGILINTCPRMFYPNDEDAQMIIVGETRIPLLHHGPNPYIPVRCPTVEEMATCDVIELTSLEEWQPANSQFVQLSEVKRDDAVDD
jgi:hypothetical protein